MKEGSSSGIGLSGILFVVFLVLKLCKVIDWSWWWITSPLWISAGFALLCAVIAFTIYVIKESRKP